MCTTMNKGDVLDDFNQMKEGDPSGMRELLASFPEQLRRAREIAWGAPLTALGAPEVEEVIVVGMGGSAIGGDILRSYLADEIRVPVVVNRGYRLPRFIGQPSLIFVSSYSGNTEETLSAYEDAKERGAKVCCLTTGGRLAVLAQRHGFTLITVPPGLPPRAALGYSFVMPLTALERWKLVGDQGPAIQETIELLTRLAVDYDVDAPRSGNLAKQLAHKLWGKLPIIYSSSERFDAVTLRWKGQLSENAKMLAFQNLFPELNHNEIVGWEVLDGLREFLIVLFLRDRDDHPRVKQRMEISREIIEDSGVEVIDLPSQGDHLLARIFSLIHLGDWVSFYLAILNGVDPTPVLRIDELKRRLSEEG